LVADGIESLADVFSSMIVHFGLKYAVKPRDENHPYVHGKAEPIAALAVCLALVGAGLLSIGIQSIREILTPHALPAPLH
jgi:divalent metal cation (Fe/Co/Zn/Cd) transporter